MQQGANSKIAFKKQQIHSSNPTDFYKLSNKFKTSLLGINVETKLNY